MRFSIRRHFCRKNKFTNQLICRLLVYNKEGFQKVDKRDPLTKNPRAETRTGCEARLYVKLDEGTGKFVVTDFKEKHNNDLISPEYAHMLPSQRKISTTQAIELDLAAQSGLCLGQSFELMGREAGGRQCLGFTKLDQKNYLRTKRQQSLVYGEVCNVLQYFKEKSLQNPPFFYAFQLDNEEQITNMFWDDAQMIMDYVQFGDVVTFDTTYKLNKEHRPFASFVEFNHYRETIIFGAALLYDETAESFDYIRSDFNLNEFFMHFERVLYEKRYKELEARYVLCQRLPKVKATIRMLIQIGNVYTKKIFEKFQNEYFRSIESDIEAIEYGEASAIYTVVDVGNKHARKVKIERDGSLGCNCTKFERERILCCHSLKVIRDMMKMKEVPLQYILKR
ncbi:protein FAR1-RELATED SEQUENCE 5-like [Camellia sinensis]|uniref:protein FAR1-RELATED SEQUENCE 5-like n=1 Tax=Camellia sinensis TaxID=4442 RepID=UPI001036CA0D|nr:protein FAR1-RELATED SEQUENCE 5-like [Camellia sinensis]